MMLTNIFGASLVILNKKTLKNLENPLRTGGKL